MAGPNRFLTSTLGTVSYNGYVFNNSTRTLKVQITPVPDASNRQTIYCDWAIKLQTWVAGSSPVDSEVVQLIERLTHKGGALVFEGRGLGNPRVNTSAARDLVWGPHPDPIEVEVYGANAIKLTWGVRFAVPCCPSANYQFQIMTLSYEASHTVDEVGMVTRRVTGFIEIPMTRKSANNNTLPDSVDNYRQILTPPLMRGFRRSFGPWAISRDRRRLDFEIVDEEMAGEALPKNVVEASWSDRVNSTAVGLTKWEGHVSASYKLRRNASGYDAARAFFARLTEYLQRLRASLAQEGQSSDELPLPLSFSMSNVDRYGKTQAQFDFSFMFSIPFAKLLSVSGLWHPIGNDTWAAWANSLRDTAFSPYGAVGIRFKPQDETLIGLCEPNQPALIPSPPVPPDPLPPQSASVLAAIRQQFVQLFPKPKPVDSWLYYENELFIEVDSGVVAPAPLPIVALKAKDDILGGVNDFTGRFVDALKMTAFPSHASQPSSAVPKPETPTTLRRTKARAFVYLRGSAARVGYVVDPPRLLDVGGVTAVPANRLDRGEGYGRGSRLNGMVEIHYCRWNLRYYLEQLPVSLIPEPPNPMVKVS